MIDIEKVDFAIIIRALITLGGGSEDELTVPIKDCLRAYGDNWTEASKEVFNALLALGVLEKHVINRDIVVYSVTPESYRV